jgi:hypothetical protein
MAAGSPLRTLPDAGAIHERLSSPNQIPRH